MPQHGNAPTLRISQAPIPDFVEFQTQTKAVMLPIVGLPMVLVGLYVALQGELGGFFFLGFGALMLLAGGECIRLWRKANKKKANLERLREHGLPGRATVKTVRGGGGRHVTLGLRVELQGREPRFHEQATVVPTMLVPRVVDGLSLPVLVDSTNSDQMEIQWHLV